MMLMKSIYLSEFLFLSALLFVPQEFSETFCLIQNNTYCELFLYLHLKWVGNRASLKFDLRPCSICVHGKFTSIKFASMIWKDWRWQTLSVHIPKWLQLFNRELAFPNYFERISAKFPKWLRIISWATSIGAFSIRFLS